MADHAVSESIYLHDPDHNGIEVYRDRKPSEWKWVGENKVYMVTEPLDVNNLLRKDGNEKWNGMPAQTSIGHIHLHVSNLVNAKKFYHQSLGLYHTASYPGPISLPQMDIITMLPPTLGLGQTFYTTVPMTLPSLGLITMQYD